mgnify:CR=1 FL=1
MNQLENRRTMISWTFYDWANSAFAATVMAGFFPIFFKQYWSAGVDVTLSTARLGMANSISGILVAAVAPLLGAIADKGSSRRKFLFFFADGFDNMTQHQDGPNTVLLGDFIDQAHLHGLLDQIHGLGINITSFALTNNETRSTEQP